MSSPLFVQEKKKRRRNNILFIFMIDSFHEQQHEKPKLPNDACLVETPGTQTVQCSGEMSVFFLLLPLSCRCKAQMANWSFTERSEVNHRLTCLQSLVSSSSTESRPFTKPQHSLHTSQCLNRRKEGLLTSSFEFFSHIVLNGKKMADFHLLQFVGFSDLTLFGLCLVEQQWSSILSLKLRNQTQLISDRVDSKR